MKSYILFLFYCSTLYGAGNQFNTYDWEVNDWSKVRVVAQNSSVSGSTSQKVTKFVLHLKQWDIRPFIKRASVYAGTDLNALKAPLFNDGINGATTDTLNNFVSGDYSETTGLTGNTTTKYISTGCTVPSLGNNLHMGVYVRTASNALTFCGGCSDSTGISTITYIAISYNGTTYGHLGTTAGQGLGVADANGTGFYLLDHPTTGVCVTYKNGSVLVNNTTAGDPGVNNGTFVIHAYQSNGTVLGWTARTLSYYTYGIGLTASRQNRYQTAVQRLQSDLNRAM